MAATRDEGKSGSSEGPAIDRTGSPVVDPSRNVLDLVEAAIKRQDDLATERMIQVNTEIARLQEIVELHASQNTTTLAQEAARLSDAIHTMQQDIADLRRSQYEALGQKTQVVETRAVSNAIVGWIFGAIGAGIGIISFVIAVTNNP